MDADLDAHDNSLEACERHPEHALEGVNDRQWIRLHNNTMFTSAQNNEDKWRGIYRMLFPHDLRVPSPCKSGYFAACSLLTPLDYQYYTVATDGPSSSLPLNFGSDYAIFFSVEHPRLLRQRLRQILESTPDVVVPGFEEELTIIYQECAEQVLRDFSNRHRDFNAPSESLNDIPTRSLQDGSDDHLPPVSTQQVPENTASNQTAGEDVPNSSGQTIQTLESLSTIQILADETTSTRTTVTSTESLENDDEEGRRCQILGVNGRPGGDGSPFAVDWGKTGDKVGLEWLTDMPVNDHLR